jgi:hypothetical protein
MNAYFQEMVQAFLKKWWVESDFKVKLSHPTHQGTGMSEYSGFILAIRNTVVQ